MVASEMAPFAQTGGLGDFLGILSAELVRRGHEVTVYLPLYRAIRENRFFKAKPLGVSFPVQVGPKRIEAELFEAQTPAGVRARFVRRDEYFDRTGFYGADGRSYEDNAERFLFFQKAAVEASRQSDPGPDIVHAHDWQAALVPVFAKEWGARFKTVLTIHNLAFQGAFLGVDFSLTNLPGHLFGAKGVEFFGGLNFIKGGILFADAVTVASERYAHEIQHPTAGCGLDAVVREHADKLHGILPGADYDAWNPAADAHLPAPFSADDLSGKRTGRDALLESLELAPEPDGAVFSFSAQLSEEHGAGLLIPILDRLLAKDVRVVVLGAGESRLERDFQLAARKHPAKFAFRRSPDERLVHLATGGSDFTLIPSHSEPSGAPAMYALRYGSLPIARACGGLHQIIRDFDPASRSGNGFLFYDYTAEALWDAIGRAERTVADRGIKAAMVREAMSADFSWSASATAYEELYAGLAPAEPAPRSR